MARARQLSLYEPPVMKSRSCGETQHLRVSAPLREPCFSIRLLSHVTIELAKGAVIEAADPFLPSLRAFAPSREPNLSYGTNHK